MKCPENYKECKYYNEDEPIESQCQTDSTVGYCSIKEYIESNKIKTI